MWFLKTWSGSVLRVKMNTVSESPETQRWHLCSDISCYLSAVIYVHTEIFDIWICHTWRTLCVFVTNRTELRYDKFTFKPMWFSVKWWKGSHVLSVRVWIHIFWHYAHLLDCLAWSEQYIKCIIYETIKYRDISFHFAHMNQHFCKCVNQPAEFLLWIFSEMKRRVNKYKHKAIRRRNEKATKSAANISATIHWSANQHMQTFL